MLPLSEVVLPSSGGAKDVPNRRVAACRSRGEKRGAYLLPLEIRLARGGGEAGRDLALSPRGGGV
jgi:hypothetical protein